MTENSVSDKPTIVFSHGAFADSSGWNDIISTLRALGYPVFATSNPLRGVKYDIDYTAATIRNIRGPIVLVGHSYGGMVINGVASSNKQVQALVFVSAFAPEAGESAADLSGKFPGGTLGPALAPPVPLPDGSNDLYIQPEKFRAQFCADVPEPQAARMGASQRPCTELALNEKASGSAWKNIPSWFVWGELDKNIPAAAHRFMAERANAREALEIKGGSHVVLIANADAVAEVILHAAKRAK
ncbi:MAG: alpha/beta hydrolase [Roseiflexaceae bacterium]|nr:alpha/beta hydrolase [Roseiflexaceae bacterium]